MKGIHISQLSLLKKKKKEKYCRHLFENDIAIEANSLSLKLKNEVHDIYCDNNFKPDQ